MLDDCYLSPVDTTSESSETNDQSTRRNRLDMNSTESFSSMDCIPSVNDLNNTAQGVLPLPQRLLRPTDSLENEAVGDSKCHQFPKLDISGPGIQRIDGVTQLYDSQEDENSPLVSR